MTKIYWYADPGHAWLKVRIADLQELGIADKISTCSYMKGEFAFLEEDCDAGIYLRAAGLYTESGWSPDVMQKTSHSNYSSAVRSYAYYQPKQVTA